MPLKVVETTGLTHDGPTGEQLVDSCFILVKDRAYFKIKRIDQFSEDQQAFVIRMKENVEIVQSRSLRRLAQLESPVIKDITCLLGTPQSRSTKRHRVVFFKELSIVSFQRLLVKENLPIDWHSEMAAFIKNYKALQGISFPNFWIINTREKRYYFFYIHCF
jgi:hypothetical protein